MLHLLSWWEKSVLLKPYDFAILGAGLIGKQIAIRLKQEHPTARIALIDKYPIPFGASTRNAGFACFGSVAEILDDFNRSSHDDVIQLAVKRQKGIQKLRENFGDDAIGFRPTGGNELFSNQEELELSEQAMPEINTLFENYDLKNVFSIKSAKHWQIKCLEHSIFNPYEGMLNTGKLNETVSEHAHSLGIHPLYGLNIKNINNSGNQITLESEQGISVSCNQLIIANNAFASQFLPDEDINPARGQIIISKPMDSIPFDGIFHADKGYIYFRNIDDRVLIGGGRNFFEEEENTFDMNGSEALKQHLLNYVQTIVLPNQKFELDMHWSGIMAMGKEKLPIVKRVNSNTVLCARMSGMGVALGPIMGEEVCKLLS
jgi:gamma-glutamylputrescine oxidase